MPRISGVYSLPSGTTAVSGTTVASAPYNAFLTDLVNDLNASRPVTAGGTGASNASDARSNLGLGSMATEDTGDWVRETRTISTGPGLTGGGDLSSNLTLNFAVNNLTGLDTGDFAGSNYLPVYNTAVGTGRISFSDFTTYAGLVSNTRTISSGEGLTGGGDLSSNRTLSLNINSLTSMNIANFTGSSYLAVFNTNTGTGKINFSEFVTFMSLVQTSRSIAAGGGLTGGGNLSSDRTISMGTPTTLGASTTNDASGSTHTHAINTLSVVQDGLVNMAVGGLGAYGFLWSTTNTAFSPGDTRAGSNLQWSNANAGGTGNPTGTWMCCGNSETGTATPRATLWRRVS